MGGDASRAKLLDQLDSLKRERDILKKKVEDLQGLLEMKDREISNLNRNGGGGGDASSPNIQRLLTVNQNLMEELTKVREQMRKMESFNQSYLSQNNTMGGSRFA